MSAYSEEDLLIKEMEHEKNKMKPRVCILSKQGLTLMGCNIPWLVIILIVVVLFFWLNKRGMLNDSVSSVMSESSTPSNVMSGGFKSSNIISGKFKAPNLGNPGQVRQMFGH